MDSVVYRMDDDFSAAAAAIVRTELHDAFTERFNKTYAQLENVVQGPKDLLFRIVAHEKLVATNFAFESLLKEPRPRAVQRGPLCSIDGASPTIGETCPACTCGFTEQDFGRRVEGDCGHAYHYECYVQWVDVLLLEADTTHTAPRETRCLAGDGACGEFLSVARFLPQHKYTVTLQSALLEQFGLDCHACNRRLYYAGDRRHSVSLQCPCGALMCSDCRSQVHLPLPCNIAQAALPVLDAAPVVISQQKAAHQAERRRAREEIQAQQLEHFEQLKQRRTVYADRRERKYRTDPLFQNILEDLRRVAPPAAPAPAMPTTAPPSATTSLSAVSVATSRVAIPSNEAPAVTEVDIASSTNEAPRATEDSISHSTTTTTQDEVPSTHIQDTPSAQEANERSLQLIYTLSKPCPKCHRDVQRYQGCKNMHCFCGHLFCYACLHDLRSRTHVCQAKGDMVTINSSVSSADPVFRQRLQAVAQFQAPPNVRFARLTGVTDAQLPAHLRQAYLPRQQLFLSSARGILSRLPSPLSKFSVERLARELADRERFLLTVPPAEPTLLALSSQRTRLIRCCHLARIFMSISDTSPVFNEVFSIAFNMPDFVPKVSDPSISLVKCVTLIGEQLVPRFRLFDDDELTE